MPTVRANGVNMYYKMTGEQGAPMLMIHGSWGNHANWDPSVPDLSKSFRVLTYDRRGHSRSEGTITQGSFEEDAEDAAALIEELKLGPVHVVGNSGGATIALKLACARPSIFRSLIIHEPPLLDFKTSDPSLAGLLSEGKRRAEAVVRLLEAGDKAGGARLFVETIAFGPGAWDKLPLPLRETFVANADTWLDETRDPLGLTMDPERLSRFREPTLLSYGGKSAPFFRPIVENLAKTIPGSRLVAYPNDGHTPHTSNPAAFVANVTEFALLSS
jgi:pimeloyl-ACP methyl ester carboxylesterase